MKKDNFSNKLCAVIVFFCMIVTIPSISLAAKTIKLRISSGVSAKHCWVAGHMDPFVEKMEKESNGRLKFYKFVAGELCKVGKSLECLKGGSIDVAAPFVTPYHAGVFPLTDVTMLPVLNTDSLNITRAYQKLFDSKVPLKDGKTFYELEVESQGLVAWPLGPTDAYVISTTGKRFNSADDIKGTPIRAGARAHLLFVNQLGATEVYMTGMDAYEAFSRGTIQGIVYSIPDWKAYGFTELIRYTITGVSLGHYPGYLAITKKKWDKLPDDIKQLWDKTAREMATESSKYWMSLATPTIKESKEKYGAVFEDVASLDPSVQAAINTAAINTWKAWIEEEEKKGHPARAVAKLWAQLVVEEGGKLPEGVEAVLND